VKANFSPAQITLDATDDSGLLMKVGTNSSLSSSEWVPYNASTTLQVTAMPATVYAQFKDIYGNQTQILSVSTPQTPQRMVYRDLSNPTAEPVDYRLFVSWNPVPSSGSGFAHYRVYRSLDGVDYTLFQTVDTRTLNYVVDGTSAEPLDPNTTYYYKVYAEDADGNTSYFSGIVSKMPTGQGGTDGTPPSITELNVETQSQTAIVTWLTDETASAAVSYCLSSCAENQTVTQSIDTVGLSHEIVITDLVPDTTYEYTVGSVDLSSNSASSTSSTFHTTPGPQITNLSIINVTNTEATITWDTIGEESTSVVTYAAGTFPNESNKVEKTTPGSTINHSVILTDITPQQIYYFYVSSQDGGSNLSEDRNVINGIRQYYMFITTGDIIPPVITNVDVPQYNDTQALVSWRTNEPANSKVEWTTTSGDYATSSVGASYDLSHSLLLSGLTASTKYFYHVISSDKDRNTATSTEFDFTTKEKQYGEAEVLVATETAREEGVASVPRSPGGGGGSVIIGIAKEEYDKVVAQLAEKTKAFTDNLAELNAIKSEVLGIATGETTDPKVLLRAVSEKFLALTKTYQEGTTLDITEADIEPVITTLRQLAQAVPPPVIKGAPKIDISSGKVIISWVTDKETSSMIAYAKKDDYDPSKSDSYSQQLGSSDVFTLDHSVTIENLLPSTEYHFQIQSTSLSGSTIKTKDYMFNTPAQFPVISDARMERLEGSIVKFVWATNVLASATVRYTPVVNGKPIEAQSATFGKPDFENSHAVILEQLKPGAVYNVELISSDLYGNSARREMPNITTGKDSDIPEITQVRTEVATVSDTQEKIQVVVYWKTNELSTSQVFYEEMLGATSTPGTTTERPKESTVQSLDMSTNHTVVITRWKSNTVYRFRVLSTDASGNVSESKDFVVKTPQRRVSIVDVIVNNFSSTFGWTKNLGF